MATMSPCFQRPWFWTAARRSCVDHAPGHADAAAVAIEAIAQAGGLSCGVYQVGQRLAGQAEGWCGRVGAIRLNLLQGAGGGLGDCHGQGVRLVLSLTDGDAG